MLSTTGIKNFGLEFYDSTVTVLPGNARVGNTILSFDGTRIAYENLTGFDSESNVYQNTLIYLENFGGAADMTQVRSDTTNSLRALDIPVLPSDSTDVFALSYPLSMLTFFTDGTSISLIKSNAI